MKQGWEREAENWARFTRAPGHDRAHDDINLPVLRELLPPPGCRTLDFGCGEGRIGRLLQSLGHQVAGIDASPSMVKLARGHEVRPAVAVADGAALPFGDEVFDLVVAYMVLHDVDNLVGAAAEIARVLESNGRLCAAIVHPLNSAGEFEGSDGDAPFVISGSYADAFPVSDVVDRDGVRLTFHSEHRPLEVYSRALEAAGLLIEAIREPKADDRLVASNPSNRRWARVPLFLHLRAVKP
jgi:SAM-dependent methyltransferase